MVKTVAVIILFAHIFDCFFALIAVCSKKKESKAWQLSYSYVFFLNVIYVDEIGINDGGLLMRFEGFFHLK